MLTPAREEVIVSEVEWHLEEPDQNIITVQNYKTRFEDFFQRVSATVQTVQYNEATYAKISTLLDANGTLNQGVLLESLNNVSGRQYSLTSDGSISINGDQILVRNLTNSANRVIINSEGIRVSSDGGNTWTTAIDGQGINIGTVYTGTLNTNEVIIGSDTNPSFRWDKSGISAYKSKEDDTYDLQTYVRYDQYGLYGIKEGGSFKAQNLQDVLDKAHFAVTWDGFFIKNSYEDGGKVSITSDNDFQVIDGTNQERIKIGSLGFDENDNRIYGINISDKNGNSILNTNNDGDLTITGTINAQAGEFSGLVQVGDGTPHINIDGVNSLIGTSNYGSSSGWMINADGDAVFNNITARGAIKTAVFEYAEIQAVGGIFIFRPSSTIKSAVVNNNDLIITVDNPLLFKSGNYCKVSNYTTDGIAINPNIDNILLNNGLSHVYQLVLEPIYIGENEGVPAITDSAVVGNSFVTNNTDWKYNLILKGAAAMVVGSTAVTTVDALVGGALIDMGNENRTSNYGIGINSSDNTVNLPARAISLFETVIDETKSPKVSYEYRGILGTLPELPATSVNTDIYNNMIGTQGIYTDNMYLGDLQQYLAFYTDKETGEKKLRISAAEISFEIPDEHGQGSGHYQNVADIEAESVPGPPGEDAIQVSLHSTVGTQIKNSQGQGCVYARAIRGNTEIDVVPQGIKAGTSYPPNPTNGDYYVLLSTNSDKTLRTARLYKYNGSAWSAVGATAQYEWTFRDENNMPITTGVPYQDSSNKTNNQFIYIDADLIDGKIIIDCKVTID